MKRYGKIVALLVATMLCFTSVAFGADGDDGVNPSEPPVAGEQMQGAGTEQDSGQTEEPANPGEGENPGTQAGEGGDTPDPGTEPTEDPNKKPDPADKPVKKKVKNGWDKSHTHYYVKDKLVKGIKKIGKTRYIFTSKGKLGKNQWIKVKGKIYRAKKNGALYTTKGFRTINKKYYFFNKDGSIKTGKFKFRGHTVKPNKKTGVISKSAYNVATGKETKIVVTLGKQKLQYYKNGKLVLTSAIVTGGPGHRTPTGTFKVRGKSRNIVLRGPGYASPVSYWIAFIGSSYGFHDASWRSSFGGRIYVNNGSHGCVNMPRGNVSKLYRMVKPGTKVVIKK